MGHFPGFDLTGKVMLVTGAGRGIGKAIALCAAEQGADLALGSRTVAELEVVAEEIRGLGRRATVGPLDVASLPSIQEFVSATLTAFGRLDVLVNNAGYNKLCPALEVTEELWDEILDTNLKGLFFMSQAVARHFVERGQGGKIINITSQVGLVGGPLRSPYCGSKGGVVNMTRALACEWAKYGITVNAVAPTFTRTPLAEKALQDPDFKADVLSRILLGRLAEPEEIAGAVLFLASDAANMVTGHTLAVDGGWTAV
jgi:2-deoxy-D-gluconate 3-dehydrogenase